MEQKYNFTSEVANITNPKTAQIILSGFGLTALKGALYRGVFDSDESDPQLSTSQLGTPVFSNVDFISGSYLDLEGNEVNYLEEDGGLIFDTVLIGVSMNKNIVKTPIQGRNGTVKEYISDGDFRVNIRGVITSASNDNPDHYPEDEVKKLMEVCRANASIELASFYLNDVFNVQNVVIENYTFPQREGTYNTQLFELECVSDNPVEVEIIRD